MGDKIYREAYVRDIGEVPIQEPEVESSIDYTYRIQGEAVSAEYFVEWHNKRECPLIIRDKDIPVGFASENYVYSVAVGVDTGNVYIEEGD